MLCKGRVIVGLYRVAKNDGIRHLHHGGFQVQRKQNAGLSAGDLLLVKTNQRLLAHKSSINDLSGGHSHL